MTHASKQRDLLELEAKLANGIKAQAASDQAKAELTVKMDALRQEIATTDRERQRDKIARQKLEHELDALRKAMATKSSEDSHRREADRSRETEMIRLRDQVTDSQKALDGHRRNAQELASKLRVDVEGLKQSHATAQRDLVATQEALRTREDALADLRVAANKSEESKRQIEAELLTVKEKISATEKSLRTAVQTRDVSTD